MGLSVNWSWYCSKPRREAERLASAGLRTSKPARSASQGGEEHLGFGRVLVMAELGDTTLVHNDVGLLDAALVPTVVLARDGHVPLLHGRALSKNATNKTVLSVSQRPELEGE